MNPLNNMPSDLSQSRESATQTLALPIEREMSSIPRGGANASTSDSDGNWVYPSPQQMYNAMLRKGYTDTPQDAVESMVAVHNFLNEGAWAEILEWERRFSHGLSHGWRECRFGEEGSRSGAMILGTEKGTEQPRLVRFMGQKDKVTPKARMLQVLGWMYPSGFGGPLPFDRHDWYVERRVRRGSAASGANGSSTASTTKGTSATDGTSTSDRVVNEEVQEVRYVIDYYSAPPEPTGEPVFYLDIRPALDRPGAAAERLIRWGRDVWWRASGAGERLQLQKQREVPWR